MTSPATIYLREKFRPNWRIDLARDILHPLIKEAMALICHEAPYPMGDITVKPLSFREQEFLQRDFWLIERRDGYKAVFFGATITAKDGGSGLVGQIHIQEQTVSPGYSPYDIKHSPKEDAPGVEIPFDISLGSDKLAAGDDEVILALVKALCPPPLIVCRVDSGGL